MTTPTQGFPHVTIASPTGGLPIEVTLIAQLGHGAGSAVSISAAARQRQHSGFVDAHDEPSVKLGGVHLAQGDASSLYSFIVGAGGHPFHRHQGHRVFTAISGSSGAQLRFSSASDAHMAADPASFVRALRYVNIPPDCWFTVRFGGGTWHQFVPLRPEAGHPALFAVSCHTNELGGALPEHAREQVLNNTATIASLTELLPPAVSALLALVRDVPTTYLSLDAPHGSALALLCQQVRSRLGGVRSALAQWAPVRGFSDLLGVHFAVHEAHHSPADSLLHGQFAEGFDHEDHFSLVLPAHWVRGLTPQALLSDVLGGFIDHPPPVVGALMRFRNAVVKPLGLRRSHLGCPVSSLVAPAPCAQWFDGQYPVLAQAIDPDAQCAQVLLGANDKHLRFRTCVSVHLLPGGDARISMGSRVRCANAFGRAYMAAIELVHRKYISPTMLRTATQAAINAWQVRPEPEVAVQPQPSGALHV